MTERSQSSALFLDVIARCAFGINFGDMDVKDSPFVKNAMELFSPRVGKASASEVLLPGCLFKISLTLFLARS